MLFFETEKCTLTVMGMHPNAAGHRLVAERLLELLMPTRELR